jgi:hypothetical protein
MTFIVNQDGQIYQKDLGLNTDQIASETTAYNPDATWQPAIKATVGRAVGKGSIAGESRQAVTECL